MVQTKNELKFCNP